MLNKALYGLAALLLLLGAAGFILGNPLFGIFEVDSTHNWIHVASGVLALWYAMKDEDRMKMFARIFGAVYLLAGIVGFLVPDGDFFEIMWVNLPDNVLHLVIGACFALLGLYRKKAPLAAAGV
jgi:hypothetical protein